MEKLLKYTFFLKNGNKIVLTDSDKQEFQIETITDYLKSNKLIAFETKTDSLVIRSSEISAIHTYVLKSDSNDKLKENNNYNISSENEETELTNNEETELNENVEIVDSFKINDIIYEDGTEEESEKDLDFFDSENFMKDFDISEDSNEKE